MLGRRPGLVRVCNSAGDSLLLESNNLFVNEAALTGETFPVEKRAGVLPADTPLHDRSNSLFTGTSNQLGEFESGLLAALFGPVPAVLIGGVGTLAVLAVWTYRFPELRRFSLA